MGNGGPFECYIIPVISIITGVIVVFAFCGAVIYQVGRYFKKKADKQ